MAGAVLVHGAWHGSWCWDAVVAELRARDVEVVAVELPLTGLDDDAAAARRAIVDSGPRTVVVGHSYGGEVISAAARDLPEVSHLIYLCALMLDADEDAGTLMTAHGSEIVGVVVPEGDQLIIDRGRAAELLYGDSDEVTVAAVVPRLRPMTFSPHDTGVPAWRSVPSTYVVCTNDRAIAPSMQRELAAHAGSVVEWPTDHSPFLTRPGDVADLVVARLAH